MAPAETNKATTAFDGQYKVVAIALDLTGKKLIDEICHVATYCPSDKTFAQYVMPHRDVSRSATRSHGIRIFCNFGKFRVLKDVKSMKTLRTKSEYSAITDLIEWLKSTKGDSDGILLAYHDNNNLNVTPFLMDALERYKMTDEFFSVVKGFANCHAIGATMPDLKNKAVTLRALARRLLQMEDNNNNILQSAKDRAEITYKVLQKLFECENEVSPGQLFPYCTGRADEMESLEKQRILAMKVKSLRPVFVSRIRKNAKDRSRAVLLRRYLIEVAIDYETLHAAFKTGSKVAIEELVASTSAKRKKQDLEELVEIIVNHFTDPNSKDMNGNILGKEMGQGEPNPNITDDLASSTESEEEEFEEAKENDEEQEK